MVCCAWRSPLHCIGWCVASLARCGGGFLDVPSMLNGEIIERYPDAQPYPSCLVLGWLASGDPLHLVCSRGSVEPALRVVTLYEPEDALWESDYKTRKVRK